MYQASYNPSSAEVLDFSEVHGASDHDPIIIRSIPWTTPHIPEPRCAQWNRRDMHRFRSLMQQSHHMLQTPACFHHVQSSYHALVQMMLHAMRTVNSAEPAPQTKSSDVSDWHEVVKQLTCQAKRRSKVFYRRIKHTLLTRLAPSTVPVPSRKIQRNLQRTSTWSTHAAGLITPKTPLTHPPPPQWQNCARWQSHQGKSHRDQTLCPRTYSPYYWIMHSPYYTIASPSVTKRETYPTAGFFLKRCAFSRAKGPGETQTVGVPSP